MDAYGLGKISSVESEIEIHVLWWSWSKNPTGNVLLSAQSFISCHCHRLKRRDKYSRHSHRPAESGDPVPFAKCLGRLFLGGLG